MSGKIKAKIKWSVTLAMVLAMLVASVAVADNVQNDVIGDGDTKTILAGASTTVKYKITANNGDGQDGCNAADTTPATVTINVPAGVSATPGSLEFKSCGTEQPVVFSSSTVGSFEITVSVSDSGTGTYNTNPAKFTLVVNKASDTTPPVINYVLHPASPDGSNGWYKSDVTLTWTVTENESLSSLVKTGCEDQTITADQQETTYSCSAISAGGSAGPVTVSIKRDATAPTVSLVGGPANGASYYFGSVPAAPTCNASDATSGLAGACSVSGYSAAVGSHTVTASATDNAGNPGSASATYTVLAWNLFGFYRPVEMSTPTGIVYNTVKGGSTVPLKFEVFAATELTDISVVKSFKAVPVTCDAGIADEVEFTTTGGTSLRYDLVDGQFIQNWQTPKTTGCYKVTMTTWDDSALVAYFRLK